LPPAVRARYNKKKKNRLNKEKTMSAKKYFIAALVLAVIAGCVPSLHELYTEDTITYDPKLVGCWETGEDEQWCFPRHKDQEAYDLIITAGEEDQRSFLIAHLVNLDGRRFLDLFPKDDMDMCTGDWYKFHLLGVHTFMQVWQTDPNLVMAVMQPDEVRSLLRKNPKLIKHEIVDDRVVFTAPTGQLQAFLSNPAIVEEIFDEPGILTRYKP